MIKLIVTILLSCTGLQGIWGGRRKRNIFISIATVPVQCWHSPDSTSMVDPRGNWIWKSYTVSYICITTYRAVIHGFLTHNTCFSWVSLIFLWFYGWNCQLLIEFTHKVTRLIQVWRIKLQVTQNVMTVLTYMHVFFPQEVWTMLTFTEELSWAYYLLIKATYVCSNFVIEKKTWIQLASDQRWRIVSTRQKDWRLYTRGREPERARRLETVYSVSARPKDWSCLSENTTDLRYYWYNQRCYKLQERAGECINKVREDCFSWKRKR